MGASFRYKCAWKSAVFKPETGGKPCVFYIFQRLQPRVGIEEAEARMTEVQKELIRAMRLQGIGYRAIARSLRLRLNKVELYCKTHGLAGDGWLVRLNYPVWCENNDRCPVCGKKLEQSGRGRKKKFCSGKCRTAWCRMKQADAEDEMGGVDV
ncbi:MAG: hypothetical protein J6I76_16220 [Oribacterium sp.]|nr:hypothetical protein [Oribacterium sp.]